MAGTVYFDAPGATTIRAVEFSVTPTSLGASDYIECEISLSSAAQSTTSDAQGLIAIASFAGVGGGSPASVAAASLNHCIGTNVALKAGERVYLNCTESGTATWRVRALVWFD